MLARTAIAVVLLGALLLVACGADSVGDGESDPERFSFESTSLEKPAVYFIHTTW